MKKSRFTTLMLFVIGMTWIVITVVPVRASTIDLVEWAFVVNETAYSVSGDSGWDPWWDTSLPQPVSPYAPSNLTGAFDYSLFNWYSGLGTITVSGFGAGSNSFRAFFDHEIDEPSNTYSNEFGAVSGTPALNQSWEIDEPGHGVPDPIDPINNPPLYIGDIYDNLLYNSLDGELFFDGVAGGFLSDIENPLLDDVSMAMGWGFTLDPGQTALLTLILGTTRPTSGFYLLHTDPDSAETIYFSGNLDVRSASVPEPGTWLLMVTGIMSLAALRYRLRRKVR